VVGFAICWREVVGDVSKKKGLNGSASNMIFHPPSVAGRNRGWPATGLPECELITKYVAALPGSTLLRGNKTCNHPIS
jgi:hypothetical protein